MGPHGVGRAAAGFAASGIEHKHIVYISVAVTVVFREVHRVVKHLACLDYHLLGALVVAIPVVTAIIFHVLRQGDRPEHVELRTELPQRTLFKEVHSRPRAAVIAEPALVEHAVEIAVGVVETHLHILVFHQYDDGFLMSFRGEMRAGE